MAISSYPASLIKRNVVTLTSGTSWTVPSGVTNIVVTLTGAGGGGQASGTQTTQKTQNGLGGQIVTTSLATTPGTSITYAIGAAGTGGTSSIPQGGAGGTTTFTGATSAVGGAAGTYFGSGGSGVQGRTASNFGTGGMWSGSTENGGAGGAGSIEIEYWSN